MQKLCQRGYIWMVTLADQGRGPGSPIFLDQTEAQRAKNNFWVTPPPPPRLYDISKIQLVVYYQCRILIGWPTTRLYLIAH